MTDAPLPSPPRHGMDAARWANVLQLDRDYGASRVELTGRPLEAYVEVAARCNLRCRMCPIIVDPRYQPGPGSQPGLMADEVFDALAPVFPTLKRAYLFGLGEPMLHPRIVDWVARAAGAGVEVWITTNATLVDQERADALARAGLYRVSVSIDGGTRETYERIRRRGSWDDVVRGLAALGEAKRRFGNPRVYLNVVGMVSNLAELPQLLELCAEHGGDGVFVEGLYAYEHPVIEEFVAGEHLGRLGRERVAEIFAEAHRIAERLGVEFLTRVEEQALSARFVDPEPLPQLAPAGAAVAGLATPVAVAAPVAVTAPVTAATAPVAVATPAPQPTPVSLPDQLRMPWLCSEPWATLNVNSAGEVRPCCFNDTVLGTLGPQTIVEIWNGAGYGGLRRDMTAARVPPTCTACVQQGRVKRNSYLRPPSRPREAARPLPFDVALVAPGSGEVVDELVLLGEVHRRPALDNWNGLTLDELPYLFIDDNPVSPLGPFGAVEGNWFAAVVPLPFVEQGVHDLSLRDARGRELVLAGRPAFQVGHRGDGPRAAVSRLAVPVWLGYPEWSCRLQVDGRRHRPLHWFCGRQGDHWLGVAVLDVTQLAPGRHRAEMTFRHSPPFAIELERLPAPR